MTLATLGGTAADVIDVAPSTVKQSAIVIAASIIAWLCISLIGGGD